MLGRTDSRGRLLFLLLAFMLVAGVLVARLGWWQIARQSDLADAAHRQIYVRAEVPAKRGSIYDRSGTVMLASTATRDRLVADPRRLSTEQREKLVSIVAGALRLDADQAAAIRDRLTTDRSYVVVLRNLDADASDAIRAGADAAHLPGINLEAESVRVYPQSGGGPNTSLGAHLIGFVNREGAGQYGVEQYYQDLLAGTPAIVESDRDATGHALAETQHTIDAGTPGADLSLTIDAGLQLALEQEVIQAWVADKARSVSAVIIDPYTGEVYAEATFPSYDANDYATTAARNPGRFVDPIVSEVYEPGSVFKMLTVVAGLETGTVTMNTKFNDTGTLRLDGGKAKIDDADRKPMGVMKFEDAIAFSRNVVAAKAALALAPTLQAASTILHQTWTRLGFGAPSGVDVAGEVGGLVRDPANKTWREIDLANGAFGQGVAVTTLQLATAYAAMVNGGTLLTPHVVKAINGQPVQVSDRGKVMDAGLSPTLIDLMHHVVSTVPFYKDRTLIPSYFVGGKTGTAQIWDSARSAWKTGVFNFSFIGYVGRQTGRPDLVIAVRINEGTPHIRRVGQLEMPVMSFELFRRIATDAMAIPGFLPELPDREVPIVKVGG
ncbi:MAG: penicillin-binding protein 2 [Candidatus Limnocylindrales bacterium]